MELSIEEIKKKREEYERKIENILIEFEKELPPEVIIDSAVALKRKKIECHITLVVKDLNS